MADAAESTVDVEIPAAPSKGRGRLIVVVAAALALLTGLGGAGWFFFLRPHGAPAPAHVEEEVRATLSLGSLVVNMKGEARRYLRAPVSLGLAVGGPGARASAQLPATTSRRACGSPYRTRGCLTPNFGSALALDDPRQDGETRMEVAR